LGEPGQIGAPQQPARTVDDFGACLGFWIFAPELAAIASTPTAINAFLVIAFTGETLLSPEGITRICKFEYATQGSKFPLFLE
jgi:hypothetical protein